MSQNGTKSPAAITATDKPLISGTGDGGGNALGFRCFNTFGGPSVGWSCTIDNAFSKGFNIGEIGVRDGRLFIAPTTGYVGFGTTAPTSGVHIYSTGDAGGNNVSFKLQNIFGGAPGKIWNFSVDNTFGKGFNISETGIADYRFFIKPGGNVGIGTYLPTAYLQIKAGTTAAGTAPFKLTTGPLNTTPEAGTIEYLSNVFYIRGSDNLDVSGTGKFSKVLTPEIKTDTTTPTDLTITTGAAKTLIVATTLFNDIQFPISPAKVPASNAPTWETFTTNTNEYAFDVDDYLDLQANEVTHDWKEGTNGHMHIHFTIKTTQSTGSDRFVKFSIWVSYVDTSEVWVEQAVLSFEKTIPTGSLALTAFYLDMGDALLGSYLRGSQIKLRVKRIAATGGTEYADSVYVTQTGMHIETDKLGSITEED